MMIEQTKQKIKYWLIGLFTGGAVAAPITAFVCKNVYEKKQEEAVSKAYSDGETQGMNQMAAYAVEHANEIPRNSEEYKEKKLTEEDYAEPTEYNVDIDDIDPDEEEARERIRMRSNSGLVRKHAPVCGAKTTI